MKRLLMIIMVLFTIGLLSACNTGGTFRDDNKEVVEDPHEDEIDELLKLTIDQLAIYNGENGNPSYIAVSGVIYEITNVSAWSSGSHNGGVAGTDITDLIDDAPHSESVLEDLEIVGEIVE